MPSLVWLILIVWSDMPRLDLKSYLSHLIDLQIACVEAAGEMEAVVDGLTGIEAARLLRPLASDIEGGDLDAASRIAVRLSDHLQAERLRQEVELTLQDALEHMRLATICVQTVINKLRES